MFNDGSIKKIRKSFTDFKDEEQWLQYMLRDGWVLTKYRDEFEEGTSYTFNLITNEEREGLIYKIDFRNFTKKEDFLEYQEIFEEGGWTVLSKKGNSKHIFYTKSKDSNVSIFSDVDSYQEREKRAMRSSVTNGIIALVLFFLSVFLYSIFERTAFVAGAAFAIFMVLKHIMNYFKYKSNLKSL